MDLHRRPICSICECTRNIQDLNQCSNCRPAGEPRPYFCEHYCAEDACDHAIDCTIEEHLTCWEAHVPRRGAKAHKKIDAFPDLYVNAVTYSESDSSRQRRLHELDRAAQWFIVNLGPAEQAHATLTISQRFQQLCYPGSSGNRSSWSQYPSLVSFVGDTGVGKSTLVRSMILMGRVEGLGLYKDPKERSIDNNAPATRADVSELGNILDTGLHGPVTRTGNLAHITDPTSSGVHLYRDPTNSNSRYSNLNMGSSQVPILFADCEGFRGGTAKTNSERISDPNFEGRHGRPRANSNHSRSTELPHKLDAGHFVQMKMITAPEYSGKGKEGAELFYARFLYAFSDVIVFVTKEDQQIRGDMQRLLEWAVSADKSVNQRPQKTLVIVRNMATFHAPEYYSDSYLKEALFSNMKELWEDSKILSDYREKYNRRNRTVQREIRTNGDLLSIFFQNVKACYIPLKVHAPTDQIFQQYRLLRQQIVSATNDAQEVRKVSWTRYNVATFSDLLHRAFEHFATTDAPFDFYTAARKDNPTPISMDGHIANLIRHMQNGNEDVQELQVIISTCLLIYCDRRFSHALNPRIIYRNELRPICEEGIRNYQDNFQQCGYKFENGNRCVAYASTHVEHCYRDLKAAGNFDNSMYPIELSELADGIEDKFTELYTKLYSSKSDTRTSPGKRVSVLRESLLATEKIKGSNMWQRLKSNKTCFTCLQSVPDHVMPCGHVYCEDCVQEIGRPSTDYECAIVMTHCALCQQSFRGGYLQLVRLRPRCAGVRVLTLDGGGVRGIVELTILEKLGKRVGLGIPITETFDLIMGTSTGGIISLALALTNLGVREVKLKFQELAKETFRSKRDGRLWSYIDPASITPKLFILFRIWESIYRTTPLKQGLIKLFGAEQRLFSSASFTKQQRTTRVAVTSSSEGNPWIVSNYSRPNLPELANLPRKSRFSSELGAVESPRFEREDDQDKEMKIWEAALCTSAAPYFFKPVRRGNPIREYADGGLHANLPVRAALQEVKRLWPSTHDHSTKLDLLLSVGTGIQEREVAIPSTLRIGGFETVCKTFFNSLNTERSWREFQNDLDYSPKEHYRLNIPIAGSYIALDDYKAMGRMTEAVEEQCSDPRGFSPYSFEARLGGVADRLKASLLFFEPDATLLSRTPTYAKVGAQGYELRGTIRCRLCRQSEPLGNFVRDVVDLRQSQRSGRTQDEDVQISWKALALPDALRRDVRVGEAWFRVPCVIKTQDKDTEHNIAVRLRLNDPRRSGATTSDPISISGFPVTFKELEAKCRQRWSAD